MDYNLFFESSQAITSSSTMDEEMMIKNNFAKYFPKEQKSTNKGTYKYLYTMLDELLNFKNISIDKFLSKESIDKLKEKFHFRFEFLNGFDFKEDNKTNEPFISDEVREKMKEILERERIGNIDDKEFNDTTNKIDTKIMILNLIFFQLLSEISFENKERAVLLYKVTSMQFVLQIELLSLMLRKYKAKIKALTETNHLILSNSFNFIKNEPFQNDISTALLNQTISKDNLNQHKIIIQKLLNDLKLQRESNYQMSSQMNILKNELDLWLYDFETLKLDDKTRQKMKALDKEKIASPLRQELTSQGIDQSEILLLINSEIFLSISNQRAFTAKQIEYYRNEIHRLKKIAEYNYNKKIKNKRLYQELVQEFDLYKIKKEKEIEEIKYIHLVQKQEKSTETQVDMFKFNKLLKNNDIVSDYKKLKHTKLSDIIESIRFKAVKASPLSKESILSLIPEILNVKRSFEISNSNNNDEFVYKQFDEFFFNYMKSKFKLRKITSKHIAECILALLNYSKEDKRIDLFRRFLKVGNYSIKSEVVDALLIILQNIPVTLYKLYSNEMDFENYYLSTEICFEIYYTKLKHLSLITQNKSDVLLNTKVFNEKEKKKKDKLILLQEGKKADLFYLSRMFKKSLVYMSDLNYEYKNKQKEYEDCDTLIKRFVFDNSEFQFTERDAYDLFERNFKIVDNKISLQSILELFNLNYSFQIKLLDFIEATNNKLMYLYDKLEEKALTVFRECDKGDKKYLELKDFDVAIKRMIEKPLDKSQVIDLFCKAGRNGEKDYIIKEEWIYFALNYMDIYVPFFEQYNY